MLPVLLGLAMLAQSLGPHLVLSLPSGYHIIEQHYSGASLEVQIVAPDNTTVGEDFMSVQEAAKPLWFPVYVTFCQTMHEVPGLQPLPTDRGCIGSVWFNVR